MRAPELTNIECFQSQPAAEGLQRPGVRVCQRAIWRLHGEREGNRFMLSDYWSGQMMWEFYRELHSENGPVYLKMDHLAPETVSEIEQILHTTERPSRGRFPRWPRGELRQRFDRDVDFGDRPLQRAQRFGGLDQRAGKRRCRACMPRGTWPLSRTATCSAPSPTERFAGGMRVRVSSALSSSIARLDDGQVEAEQRRSLAAIAAVSTGIPPHQFEYKLRRHVNDYLQPPRSIGSKRGLDYFERARQELEQLGQRIR